MKKILLTLLICNAIYLLASSQTYVGLSAGLDWAKIGDEGDTGAADYDFDITDNGFSKRSRIFSINCEHYNSKKISVALSFFCTEKDFESHFYGFISHEGRMKYRSYGGSILVKYYFSDYFYVGTGLSMIYVKGLSFYTMNMIEFKVPNNSNNKYGAPIIVGLKYKNFFVEPYYLQGFWLGTNREGKYDIRPINAFGFLAGYQIRVSKKKNTVYGF